MIEAILEKPGFLWIVDATGKRQVVSVSSMRRPQATGPSTTLLKFTGYRDLFVCCPIDEARAAMKRARVLRKARNATASRRQLLFDFNEKTAAQSPNQTAAANTHPTDEACDGGS
jgi:hypothetical protein